MNGIDPVALLIAGAVVVAFIVAGMVLGPKSRESSRLLAFSKLRRVFGARLLTQDGDPRVRFRWRDHEVLVFERTFLCLEVQDLKFSAPPLVLESHGANGAISGRREAQLVPGFDAIAPLPVSKEFLGGAPGRILRDLLTLEEAAFEVRLGRSMQIKGPAGLPADALIRFVQLSLRLAEQARVFAAQSSEVAVLDLEPRDGTECPVCGADLGDLLVRCAGCRAPHHRECWDYVGACSMFGCGERRSVRA